MEYQQCHHHLKTQWKRQQGNWLEGRLSGGCFESIDMRVKRTPRYYQHHAALTLTLTTITVLLSIHLVLLGDAVGASADVDPQDSDKVLLPTLDGKSSHYFVFIYVYQVKSCKDKVGCFCGIYVSPLTQVSDLHAGAWPHHASIKLEMPPG